MVPLNRLTAQTILTYCWKNIKGLSPGMDGLINKVEHERGTRMIDQGNLRVPHFAESFRYRAAHVWNYAPAQIKLAASEYMAKRLIKDYVKTLPF